MKRLHVSLSVTDIEKSKAFYASMFGQGPTMEREEYVQWELNDPPVNFVIGGNVEKPGLSHLGIQAGDDGELQEQFSRVDGTGANVFDEDEATCCYARSTKKWASDPDGFAWETFLTHERIDEFGTDDVPALPIEDEVKSRAKKAHGGCC